MKINPFDKYLTKEDLLHIDVINYLKLQYGKRDIRILHCPNEGRRTPFERYKAKLLGLQAGWPDLMIFEKGTYSGLAIELKIKPNKITEKQRECLEYLDLCGWKVNVCYTFEEAKEVIDTWFSVTPLNKKI